MTGPEQVPPPRSRGVIALQEDRCTSCMLCARECPDWCIHIDSHPEPVPASPEGGRARVTHVLDRFAIDWSLCMYCGICVEVCPFDALFWAPALAPAQTDLAALTHERDRLGSWLAAVPPPETDPPAEQPTSEEPADEQPPDEQQEPCL